MDQTRVYLTEGLDSKSKKKLDNKTSKKLCIFLNLIGIFILITGITLAIYLYMNSIISIANTVLIIFFSINFPLILLALSSIINYLIKINNKLNL